MAQEIGLKAILDDANFQAGMSRYMSGLSTMTNSTTNASTGMTAGFVSLGGSVLKTTGFMAKAFVGAGVAATVALGGIVTSSVGAAADLEANVSGIAAVLNKTKEEVQPLSDLIIDLGIDPRLKVSAEEAADAIALLARNGLTMDQILGGAAFNTVLLANSTGTTFGNAADIATDAMAVFSIEAEDMSGAVDGITSVTTNSKFTIDDYALALANSGAVANKSGVPFNQFNATIAAISSQFASGGTAGTGYKNMLLRLAPTTDTAKDAMAALGIITEDGTNRFFDAEGGMKSMNDVALVLEDAFAGLSVEQRNVALRTIFGNDAMGAALGLMDSAAIAYTDAGTAAKALGVDIEDVTEFMEGGITEYEALMISMEQTSAVDAAATRMDNFRGVLEILTGLIDTVKIQIGNVFLPIFRKIGEAMTAFVDKVGPQIVGFFAALGAVITSLIERGDFPWEDIFPPWLAAIAQELADKFYFMRDALSALFQGDIVGAIGQMGMAFGMMEDTSFDLAEVIVGKVGDAFNFIVEHADAFIGAAKGLLTVLGGAGLVAILSTIAGVLATILSPIGLVVIAIAALGAAWETNFLGIRDIVTAFWFDTVQPVLAELMVWLFENVPLALEALRAAWVDVVFPAILGIIEFVWPIIQALFGIFVEYITGVFIPTLIALWEFWATVLWPGILEAVATVWPIIQEILVAASEWFLTVLIPTLQQLFVFWSEVLWPGIIAALTAAWEFMFPILTSLAVWFLETFIPALISLWETWSIVVWPAIIAALEEAWAIIQPILNNVWIFIVDTLIPGVTELWTAWMDAWDEIDRIVTEAWAVIEGIFKEIDRWINVNLIPFVEAWQAKNEETWAAIMAKIIEVWNIIWPILEKIRMWFEEKLTAAADAVKEKIEGAFNGIKGAIDGAKSPLESFFDKVKEFQGWLEGISFDFEFNIPDLPDWFLPGSPLPLHTAWKNFGTFLDRQQFAPQVDVTEAVNLATPLAESSSPVVNVDGGSTQNNFNLNMTTTSDEVSLRQTFRLMELASA